MSIVFQVISMVGGLALFLYGMNMLGTGLEKVSGGKLERTLEKMTSNVFKGVLVGAVITAAIQSSSATTVIVVGLVNAGILKLRSAIGVIMGANIGTTITGQILRLAELSSSGDSSGVALVLEFLKPDTLAPIVTVIGLLMFMMGGKKSKKAIGEILLGFGILFTGMLAMTDAVEPLSELPIFTQMFAALQNPVLGVLAGTIVTAAIQSSSASVGILQALAQTGAITYSAAFPIIMGQNIGTTVTSLLSSIGANVNARRAAMVHLYFNIIGTFVFLCGVYGLNALIGFSFWNESIGMGGIANFHTLFNVVVTILFLPFTGLLEKLAVMTIKDKEGDTSLQMADKMNTLDDRFLKSPSIALGQCENVVTQMGEFAKENFSASLSLFGKYNAKQVDNIREREDAIDRMEDRLNNYLLELTSSELTNDESRNVTRLLKLDTEFERIGDYTINLVEGAEMLFERESRFSPKALDELKVVYSAVEEIIGMAIVCFRDGDMKMAAQIEPLEETVDMMVDTLKNKHVERLKKGKCTIDGGFVFLEVLTNLERISDHCSNVAVTMLGYKFQDDSLNRHEYIRKIHAGDYTEYANCLAQYRAKYFDQISTKVKESEKPKDKEKAKSKGKKKSV